MHKIPKGQNLAQRTLERFYFWGCVDELRGKRMLPPEVPAAGVTAYKSLMSEYWHVFAGRDQLLDVQQALGVVLHVEQAAAPGAGLRGHAGRHDR